MVGRDFLHYVIKLLGVLGILLVIALAIPVFSLGRIPFPLAALLVGFVAVVLYTYSIHERLRNLESRSNSGDSE